MTRLTRPLLLVAALGSFPTAAHAQFSATQVSGPGAAPFLVSKTQSSWEAVPGVTFNIYRRLPGGSFDCLVADLPTTSSWTGDPGQPASAVWWYTVNAWNASEENQHGNEVAIGTRCHTTPLCTPVPGTPPLRLVRVLAGGGFTGRPIHLTTPAGDRNRLFVADQSGRIRILTGGALLATPFLDINTLVRSPQDPGGGNEQGLLGMAFHPDYASNGRFFVYYTADPSRAITVAEYRVSANPDVADPTTARVLYTCAHTEAQNHDGGPIEFGPNDGYLYIGTGDGGNSCDEPNEDSENLASCLGKILRIDVDGTAPPLEYRIPPTNPFLTTPGALPEIWAYGLRNPWKISFDPANGDLYIGDVGQNQYEEIDVQPGTSAGGEDYGWDMYEGDQHCYASCPPEIPCDPAGKTWPVVDYPRADGCSVTGGVVYRGCRLPGYAGTYFYADYCSSSVWSFVYAGGVATNRQDWSAAFTQAASPTSFGVDADGEVYILNSSGSIWQISD